MNTFVAAVAFLATVGYVVTGLVYVIETARRKVVPFGLLWSEISFALIAILAHVSSGYLWQAALDGVLAALGVICLTLRIRLQELRDGHRDR